MRVSSTLDKIREHYGNKVKIVYKNYVVHPTRATIPALAACAADKQGKFHEMYKKVFAHFGRYTQAQMDGYAKELGLNMGKYKADMNGVCKKQIRQEQMELAKVGTRGTPAFYINGRFLGGNRPFPHFQRLIDEVLKQAEAAKAKGMPVSKLYQELVVKKGKKTL